MKSLKHFLPWVLFGLYILGIQYLLDWRGVLSGWRDFPASTLVIGAMLIYLSYATRSLRFYRYFSPRCAIRPDKLFRLTLHHNFLNNLLPARSGEISFPVLMKRYFGAPYRLTAPGLLWLRLLDLHTILTLGVATLLWQQHKTLALAVFLLIWPALPWAAYALRGRFKALIGAHSRISALLAEGFPQSVPQFVWSWALTWANWLVKLLALAWILSTLLTLHSPVAIIGVIVGELTSILPIHAPAGVGSYEAGVIAGLAPFGVDLARAGSAAVNLHLFVLGVASSGGLLAIILGWRDDFLAKQDNREYADKE